MAYTYEQLEQQAVEAINKYKLFFNEDIIAYLPCSSSTFYDYKLGKSERIKDALAKVRIDIKVSQRSKWYKSESSTLQIALYKLIANDEERRRLTQQHISHGGEVHHKNQIDPTKLKSETLRDLFENGIVSAEDESEPIK